MLCLIWRGSVIPSIHIVCSRLQFNLEDCINQLNVVGDPIKVTVKIYMWFTGLNIFTFIFCSSFCANFLLAFFILLQIICWDPKFDDFSFYFLELIYSSYSISFVLYHLDLDLCSYYLVIGTIKVLKLAANRLKTSSFNSFVVSIFW